MAQGQAGAWGGARSCLWTIGILFLGAQGCSPVPDETGNEEPVGEVSQASQGPQGQGSQGQGSQGQGSQGQGSQAAFTGAAVNGVIPSGYQLGKAKVSSGSHWYFPSGTALVKTSTLVPIGPSANSPFYLTGAVRPAPGVTFSGVNGDTVNLRIVGYKSSDSTTNLFALPPANPYAPSDSRSNSDVTLYKVEMQTGPSTWTSLCPLGGEGVSGSLTASGAGWAVLIRGTYDTTATASELSTTNTVPGAGSEVTIACTNGVIAKCARQWGYKPWKSAPNHINGFEHDLRPYHQMCLRAARADYCSDGSSFTVDGTMIDIEDTRGFVQRESEHSSTILYSGEATFTVGSMGGSTHPEADIHYMAQYRHDEITQTTTCDPPAVQTNAAFPWGGSWFSRDPSNLVYDVIWVGSKGKCGHKTSETGDPLMHDCNYCTRRVCDPRSDNVVSATGVRGGSPAPSSLVGDGYCCEEAWDAQCVSEAAAWCSPSVWSSDASLTAWETGDTTPVSDWYALAGPNGEYRYDFIHSPKDYGALGTAPYGTPPATFPSVTGARWVGSQQSAQATGYYRMRFRGWKTGWVNVYINAYNTFQLYFDGSWLGGGATPGGTYNYLSIPITLGKEHLVAVKVEKLGGGHAFALDIR